MGKIIHNRAKSELKKEFGDKARVLTMGLPFAETLEETARQVHLISSGVFGCVTVSVGSGIICAGLIRGFMEKRNDTVIYGIAIRHFDLPNKKKNEILTKAGALGGLMHPSIDFRFVNTDYEYLDFEELEPPFPCNPYYDRKAWRWFVENYDQLEKPALFWNVGSGGVIP